MRVKRTDELVPGDRVMPGRRHVRTVATIEHSGFLNRRNEVIYSVRYLEGDTPEWSGGNSGIASSEWVLATDD